jgi:geranylgeranyl diphosphate synthase type I
LILSREEFFGALKERSALVMDIFNDERYYQSFMPEILREAVYSYLKRPAKRFRPGVLFFSCGAVGGDEQKAQLAAAAVEVYHTWTLVHDDIIDNDSLRRGQPTVHEEFRTQAQSWGYPPKEAVDLGRSIAILAGDLQHAWSVRLLLDLEATGLPLPVIADLIRRLEVDVTNGLIGGEALDVLYARRPIAELTETDVLKMLELKTGVLYEYAGIAGASIGLQQTAVQNNLIGAIGRFAKQCGTAFQIQDDILGLTGDEKVLGKPIDSDIREGKRTVIALHAYHHANIKERQLIADVLGNAEATGADINRVKQIFNKYQGVEYAKKLAESIVSQAISELDPLPDSKYKDLLLTWAQFVVNRDF